MKTTYHRDDWSHPDNWYHVEYQIAWNRRLWAALYVLYWFVAFHFIGPVEPGALIAICIVVLTAPIVVAGGIIAAGGIIFGFVPALWRWLRGEG